MQSIKKQLLINASQETAFRVFTERMGDWWPKSHHIGKTPPTDSIIEQKEEGRWYSIHEDGSECELGKVLVWDPFGRLLLAWQVDGNFKYDPNLISELEFRFHAEEPGRTRVTMEHRDLEKLMGGAKIIADMNKGWEMILNLYKNFADEA
ncbi:MAG TPA: SRPBCC family protein [Puia sp.]|uniref:SRPBCC family protein n=1 Tax=Puia sp. TaxID=2045100 RepID=UPI002CC4A617|nr:SRPBCC family protein [Puia sp.]HVU94616.1 SRPBCC family protein [Puia sp.]